MIMYRGFQEFLCCDLFNQCMILASSIAIVVKFNLKLEDNDCNLSIARTYTFVFHLLLRKLKNG